MSQSFLLTLDNWDFCVDAFGNWAVCNEPYSTAQDIACALRTFSGELWYDASQGLPYITKVLGQQFSMQLLKTLWISTALTVPTVASATAIITNFVNRKVTGQVQAKLTTGAAVTVATTASSPWYIQAVSPGPAGT
jgi:hypothetical protein